MGSILHRHVLTIVGPTASGKSKLAMAIAESIGGEIIGADSRQVYRHMDIGTAKPTRDDRERVPHHLIDVVDPDEDYSVALFTLQARRAIQCVLERGRLPIVAGGTGQYVWALLEGWNVPDAPPDEPFRRFLHDRMAKEGLSSLVRDLEEVAPAVASRVDLANPRRVIRALELAHNPTNREPRHPPRTPPPFESTVIGLTLDRERLYERIDARADAMFAAGWIGEVENLARMGFGPDLPSMSGHGYREICALLRGEQTIDETIEEVKRRTRRFARQQRAWFRASDERIRWFPSTPAGFDDAISYAREAHRRALSSGKTLADAE